jgi:glucose-1-phosphate cytidylyltransferase
VLLGSQGWINGGFMVFERGVFDYLASFNECSLETEVFTRLVEARKLAVYPHHGYWQCLDTDREFEELNGLCQMSREPWFSAVDR